MADSLISDGYKALLAQKHDAKPWGGAGKSWVPLIATLVNRLPAGSTMLDYGCGRGTFKPAMEQFRPDITVTEYDPGVRGKDKLLMSPVSYVVCTDVMEHVEEEFVEKTLRTLDWLAIDGVFFNIDTALSKSFLPDGRNTHITIHPSSWWKQRLDERFPGMKWKIHEETRSRIVISGFRDKGLHEVEDE